MKRDACVSEPGRSGVPQPVPGEVVEPELLHEVVPVGRIADGGGGEDSAAGSAQERVGGLLVVGEAFEDGFEGVEHWDGAVSAAFGLFDDEAASSGVVLASDPHDAVVPVHIPSSQSCDLGAAGGEEGGEHDVIGIRLVHLSTRVREPLQRGKVRERVLA